MKLMERDHLLRLLAALAADGDGEKAHVIADAALLDYINDPEITAAYRASHPGWCA